MTMEMVDGRRYSTFTAGTITIALSSSNRALISRLCDPGKASILIYVPDPRWFMPRFHYTISPLDEDRNGTAEFTVLEISGPVFKNHLAQIVYWLRVHILHKH
jgi:hypothetical protein